MSVPLEDKLDRQESGGVEFGHTAQPILLVDGGR